MIEKEILQKYYRVYAKIDLDAIENNIIEMKKNLGEHTQMAAVLKTDGYGHGAVPVASVIKDKVRAFAVATIDEGMNLRRHGIENDIFILGFLPDSRIDDAIKNNIWPAIFSFEMAQKISRKAEKAGIQAKIQIKVDTGMGRIGFRVNEDSLKEVIKIAKLPYISIEGIFTHFATADESDKSKARKQYDNFCMLLDELSRRNISFTYRHCSNSAAIIDMPECTFEWVRQGITLYGLTPSYKMVHDVKLYPAMELKSHVVHIKTVEKGDEVSYGGIYTAESERRIATVSIGYGDGYPRQLSNKGYVLIRGQKAPIVGRVCMDQFMVDVTDIDGVELEDTVTLFGSDGEKEITVDELSDLCGRFNYEFVCDINKRVKRIYVE